MDEYQTATLTLQESALALQESALALQQASLTVQVQGLWLDAGLGLLQSGLIAWGLWLMTRAGRRRDRELDTHTATLEAHTEALRELLRRTAPKD